MRRMLIYSVFDVKAGAYLRPYFAETRGLAIRTFSDVVNDATHEFSRHAADYTLFELGSFDVESGEIVSRVESIGTALQFIVPVDIPVRRTS